MASITGAQGIRQTHQEFQFSVENRANGLNGGPSTTTVKGCSSNVSVHRWGSVLSGTRALPGYSVFGDGDTSDCYGHGTFVASEVGGLTYGVAKNVTLYSGASLILYQSITPDIKACSIMKSNLSWHYHRSMVTSSTLMCSTVYCVQRQRAGISSDSWGGLGGCKCTDARDCQYVAGRRPAGRCPGRGGAGHHQSGHPRRHCCWQLQ